MHLYEVPRVVKLIKTENRKEVTGSNRELFNRYRVSVWDAGKRRWVVAMVAQQSEYT